MAAARREICIKTPQGTFCKASPIEGCGCGQPAFKDPYEGVLLAEEGLDDKERLIDALTKVIKHDHVILDGKGAAVVAVVKLLLLRVVDAKSPFIITGLSGQDWRSAAD